MDYILRLDEAGYDTALQVFSDEAELTAYLAHLTEIALQDGTGTLVKGIWCWDDDDERYEMDISLVAEVYEGNGYLDHHYRADRKDGKGHVLRFTARTEERRT